MGEREREGGRERERRAKDFDAQNLENMIGKKSSERELDQHERRVNLFFLVDNLPARKKNTKKKKEAEKNNSKS